MPIEEWIYGRSAFRQVDSRFPVWEIKRPKLWPPALKAVECEKIELVSVAVTTFQPLFLMYSEDPHADALAGEWSLVLEGTWRVPREVNSKELCDWLFLGGWFLYSAEAPIDPHLLGSIGFSPSATTVVNFVQQHELALLIIAFHDNDPWTIALRP